MKQLAYHNCEQNALWSLETMPMFVSFYAMSIRGTNDQRGYSGYR